MSDAVWISLIAVLSLFVSGTVGPMLTLWWGRRLAKADRDEDRAERKIVAAKADNVANLLDESRNERNEKLDRIEKTGNDVHVLVNSQLTNIKNSLRTTLVALMAALKDTKWPNADTEAAVEAAKKQISALDADLADRAVQQAIVDKK